MYWSREVEVVGRSDDELRKEANRIASSGLELKVEVSVRYTDDWNAPRAQDEILLKAPVSVLNNFSGLSKGLNDVVGNVTAQAQKLTAQYIFDALIDLRTAKTQEAEEALETALESALTDEKASQ